MDLLAQPLQGVEFLAVDTETNGLSGDQCELTEVGAVLVGGGELHDTFESLVRWNIPLRRGIQRFTGISQAMVVDAREPDEVLPQLAERMRDRVLVAHNAPFDRRVLRQAFDRIGLEYPDPPILCTALLARKLLPLQRERRLAALADALGIEVHLSHRALADAETCGRVLCALFPRLCANALTVADAIALCKPRRRSKPRKPPALRAAQAAMLPQLDFGELPKDPGVYVFRDAYGKALYVGKSISIRSRARAHFAPSTPHAAWTQHAAVVDYRATSSELGALVLENRLIKQLKPPGNTRLTSADDKLVYIRCRLDIPFPILDVAPAPAAGHAVSIGPLKGRRVAHELVEQLDSLFGLRHCGRTLPRRQHPSAYGQMGRCLSPCLGDLDPNLYRRRLDAALAVFTRVGGSDGPRERLIAHVHEQMRAAAAKQQYERAAWLRGRAGRLSSLLRKVEGVLEATHARPRLVIAAHPTKPTGDVLWLVGGRLVDFGPLPGELDELCERTAAALLRGVRAGEAGAQVPPAEIDEIRLIDSYLASHPDTPRFLLDSENRPPDDDELAAFAAAAIQVQSENGRLTTVAA
jgi:DNA polymerase-3 subunit epsilon